MTPAEKTLFQPLPKGPISDIIVDRITECLINGELKPGDKIPTEVELSENLGIGRNGVREAIKVLVAFGVLEVRRSEGTFVVDQFKYPLLNPMLYGLIFAQKSMSDMLEFKIYFLQTSLSAALEKATAQDVAELREMYCNLRDTIHEAPEDINSMYRISRDFHLRLGNISRNPLIEQMNHMVHRISKYSRVKAFEAAMKQPDTQCLAITYLWMVELLETRNVQKLYETINSIKAIWEILLLHS